jgi:transcriptional regulator with XRE-family HTH domain
MKKPSSKLPRGRQARRPGNVPGALPGGEVTPGVDTVDSAPEGSAGAQEGTLSRVQEHKLPLESPRPGARLRESRKAAGLTQEELARAVGVSRSAVAQWETDRSGQVGGNLARIAAVLGVAVAYLLTGAGPREGGGDAENATETALLRLYRSCSEEDRALLLRTAARLARHAGAGDRAPENDTDAVSESASTHPTGR